MKRMECQSSNFIQEKVLHMQNAFYVGASTRVVNKSYVWYWMQMDSEY